MSSFFRDNIFSVALIVILAIRSITDSNFFSDPLGWLIGMLVVIPGIIIGITVHEYAHALAAYKLGDITPKAQKRVSLNPIRHIDPIGFIALLLIGFGWGKPVQVNPYAFDYRRRRACNLITDVAGIATNFVLAFIIMGLTSLFIRTVGAGMTGVSEFSSIDSFLSSMLYEGAYSGASNGAIMFVYYAVLVLVNIVIMNLVLMIFNLLPVPPLDGFGIVTEVFDLRDKPIYDRIYMMGFPILMVLILLDIPSRVISPIIDSLYRLFEMIFF